jgi:hypothetical protein
MKLVAAAQPRHGLHDCLRHAVTAVSFRLEFQSNWIPVSGIIHIQWCVHVWSPGSVPLSPLPRLDQDTVELQITRPQESALEGCVVLLACDGEFTHRRR